MTNPNDKEWWYDERYWTELNQPDYGKVVAEAERRTWKGIVGDVEDLKNPFPQEYLDPQGGLHYAFETCRSLILSGIDAKRRKLASLANDKEV